MERLIVNDPLFLDEQTLVFPVPSIDSLEEANRGVVLERHGKTGDAGHASFLLEARFDEERLAARVMVAATKSLTTPRVGAYSLLDLPMSALWGQQGFVEQRNGYNFSPPTISRYY